MTLEAIPPIPQPHSPAAGEGLQSASVPPAAHGQLPRSEVSIAEPVLRPGMLDALAAGFVCALAFLLASIPARNSDLWLHLASGRALVQGDSPRGSDPFASTTTGVFWVNHSWLGDALLYESYQLGGGKALVVSKSVFVTVLAGLLFCFRRRGTRVLILALAAAGAVLALGPWLLLQPALLSLPAVVLTLYLLERPALVEGSQAERARTQRFMLVPLFALWANLDGWFLLGPLLVTLYALGCGASWPLAGRSGKQQTCHHGWGECRALILLSVAGPAA